ncbi:MAG TPA: DUF6457 domain-containing protein [Pseudolysinimonas sp.]
MSDDDEMMTEVRVWAAEVSSALGIDASGLDIDAVLGIAGLAARSSVRPAAPVTTYLVGYAAGRATAAGSPPAAALSDALSAVRALVAARRTAPNSDEGEGGRPA